MMGLVAVFIFNLLLFFMTIISFILLENRKTIKSYRYLVLWILWVISIVFKVFADLSIIHEYYISRFLGAASLWVNAFAYLQLIGIVRGVKPDRTHYISFFCQTAVWLFVSLLLGNTSYTMSFYNSVIIFITLFHSIIYKRWWFAGACLFTGSFFFEMGIAIQQGIRNIPFMWILTAIGAILAIVGTIVNGGKNDKNKEDI
jgi:hypothetical protein